MEIPCLFVIKIGVYWVKIQNLGSKTIVYSSLLEFYVNKISEAGLKLSFSAIFWYRQLYLQNQILSPRFLLIDYLCGKYKYVHFISIKVISGTPAYNSFSVCSHFSTPAVGLSSDLLSPPRLVIFVVTGFAHHRRLFPYYTLF